LMVVGLLRALNTERTRLSAVLRSAAEPVLTTDTRGTIETINPAMERLAGWSESEARGRKYSEVYRLFDARGEAVGDDKRLLARAIRERKPIASHGFESFLESKDGIRIPVSITASPVIDDKGVLTGGVDVLRDVSREKEIDHMKSSLISTVSHELRTPLTMIQGFAELLLTREFDRDNSREALSQIHKSAERLGRLIEDLLSVSRIESGRLTAKKSRMELGPAIAEGIAAVSPSRQVEVQIDEDLPAAFADKDMVVQIVTNLVSNAVKYSPHGAPVRVAARANGASLQVSVADQGIGLSSAESDKLFNKFYRVDRPEVKEAGGTGLGLYITKSLVENQGGTIAVESVKDKGSTFTFSLPLAPDDDVNPPEENEKAVDR
ncbi:MAG: sensor histidine kinase, partial [Actinomycetota bacterium]